MGFFGNSMGLFGNSADQLLARGVGWAVKGEFDRAIPDFEEVIRLDPKCADAFYNRAKAYAEQRQYDRAIADYDAAIKLNPKDMTAAIKSRAAVIALKKERDGKPDADTPATPKMASMEAVTGDVAHSDTTEDERTNMDFDRATRRHPKEGGAFGLRDRVHVAKKRHESTIVDMDEAIQSDPKEARDFNGRACRYLIKGQFDRAIADFDEAIRLDPNFSTAIEMRAVAVKWKNELGGRSEHAEHNSDSNESADLFDHSNQAETFDHADVGSHHGDITEAEFARDTGDEADNIQVAPFLESPRLIPENDLKTYGGESVDLTDESANPAMGPGLNGAEQESVTQLVAVEKSDARATPFRPVNRELSENEREVRNEIYEQADVLEAIYQRVPPGRCRTLALNSLEESVMWIVKGLAS
jgi:tetratricopeptide (TPR) repeat protein